jgi:protease IV
LLDAAPVQCCFGYNRAQLWPLLGLERLPSSPTSVNIPMVWPFSRASRKSIARIEVTGVIAAATRKRLLEALKEIEERRFPALLLRIDSPGGTVGDSQEIYTALRRLKDKLKIVASFGNISASGGVYIGMGADYIVANPGTITGSIGVILRGNNLERLLDRVGVSFKVIKSGPYKDILAFDRELTDSEKGILQELIDISYGQFVKTVAEARRLSEDTVRSFADGRIFTGEQALQLGVVDRLGSEDDARRWAAELVDLDPNKAECITFEEKKPLLQRLVPGRSRAGLEPAEGLPYPALAVPALNATLEWLEFERTTSGVPLWLYRP